MKNKCISAIIITVGLAGVFVHAQSNSQVTAQTNPPPAFATQDYVHKLGVGAEFGAPIGVNAKYWLTDAMALDAAVGWSPYPHSTAEVHADFLFHDFDLLNPPEGKMPVYVGGGLLGRFRDDNRSNLAGFRFPIGVSYMFDQAPVDIFAEVAPEIIFAPFGRGSVDGSVGFRFWF